MQTCCTMYLKLALEQKVIYSELLAKIFLNFMPSKMDMRFYELKRNLKVDMTPKQMMQGVIFIFAKKAVKRMNGM